MQNIVPQFVTNMDVNIDFFQKLALAALIGILIGIEREHRRARNIDLIAGVRSFTISCISGMIVSYLAQIIHLGILLISLGFFAIISILFIYIKNVTLKQPGITGPIALYCTFLLGVLIAYDFYLIAIVVAVLLTLLLAEKPLLHSFAANLTDDEILSAVRFLAVVFILYPLTPNKLYFDIINPRWVLLIVIIVATISFISFVVMKRMGNGGITIIGMLGGLINSEATTGALSAMAKKREELVESSHVGIILSNATMLIRNLVIAFIVDPTGRVVLLMAPPQLLITAFTVATVIRTKTNPMSESIHLQSPFALSSAIKFAIGFAGLSIASKFANMWAGVAGVYAIAIGGLISSAVVTASVTLLAVNGFIPATTAAFTGVMASIISTGNKIILVRWAGSSRLLRLVKKTFISFVVFGMLVLIGWVVVMNYY